MLYLVGGASRAGKTIIAKKIAAQRGLSYFSLDWLVMGFTNGIPEYGIHDLLYPDEIAKRSWSFLKAMFESIIWSDTNYIIEGEAILPELITELLKKYPDKLKKYVLSAILMLILMKKLMTSRVLVARETTG